MIFVWVSLETVGKVLPRSTIMEKVHVGTYGCCLGRCDAKKRRLLPQNGPKSLGPEKSWKNCHTEITVFEPVE
jgi:hypothetical protein